MSTSTRLFLTGPGLLAVAADIAPVAEGDEEGTDVVFGAPAAHYRIQLWTPGAGAGSTSAPRITSSMARIGYTVSYDEIEPGIPHYVHDAILANAGRLQRG